MGKLLYFILFFFNSPNSIPLPFNPLAATRALFFPRRSLELLSSRVELPSPLLGRLQRARHSIFSLPRYRQTGQSGRVRLASTELGGQGRIWFSRCCCCLLQLVRILEMETTWMDAQMREPGKTHPIRPPSHRAGHTPRSTAFHDKPCLANQKTFSCSFPRPVRCPGRPARAVLGPGGRGGCQEQEQDLPCCHPETTSRPSSARCCCQRHGLT